MRQTITQEDDMGCGVACVAFVANKSYQHIVEFMGQEKARSVGFMLKEMVEALNEYGFDYRSGLVKPKTKRMIYQEGVIVFIKRSQKYPYGHYLIRHQGLWVDPWINMVRDTELANAKSGYRQRLPGQAQWAILPQKTISPQPVV